MCSAVFKFVELPENNEKQSDQKSKVKFKIMSLKVKAGVDYVPELVSFLVFYVFCTMVIMAKSLYEIIDCPVLLYTLFW